MGLLDESTNKLRETNPLTVTELNQKIQQLQVCNYNTFFSQAFRDPLNKQSILYYNFQ